MKKNFFLLAALAVTLFSCVKEKDFNSGVPAGPGETISFAAGHEADVDPTAKTSMDDSGNVTWSAGDKMQVVYDGGTVETTGADAAGATANFTAELPSGTQPLFVVYPSTVAAEYNGSNLVVTVPATQDGTFANAAIEVAPFGETTSSLKNLGGLLQLNVSADVDEIVIHSNNSQPLVGDAAVTFSEGIPTVTVANGATSLTLSGLAGPGTYYAAVLPGSFEAGIYVELKKEGALVGEKISGNTLSVARRQVMRIPVGAPGVIANKVFVTVDGAGTKDGSSWENAKDKSGFFTVIKNATNETVFMAEGTYLPASEVTVSTAADGLKVYGGYPTGLTGTSLNGRDIVNHPTVLSGNGERRIFVINKNTIVATFDGLEFRDALRTDKSGDMGSALVINTCSNVKVYNCVFDGNTNQSSTTETSASTAAGGGGAIRAVGGTILFKGCTFSNNSAVVGGGAMRVAGSANVTLDACVFSGNTATTCGGAVHMSKGTLTVKNCQFNNNTASTNGGAISVTQQAACTVNIADTQFFHNRAGSTTGYCGGALFVGKWDNTSDVTLDHCYFEENLGHATDLTTDLKTSIVEANASTGGAIFVEKNATLKLNHCKFYHNLCSQNGGAIRTKEATAVLYMNACSFYMNYSGKYAAAIQGTSGPIAMYNCVFYNNQNKTTTSPGTVRSSGEVLVANTSLRVGSSYPGIVFGATAKSVMVNNYFVNSGAGNTPELKKAVAVGNAKSVSSFGHNLYSGLNVGGSSYGTIDNTNAPADSDQEIGLNDFPSWVGTVSGIEYHLLKITSLPETYYKTNPAVDFRATPAEVADAIDYFDTQNSTAFKAWLNTLDEGSGRKPLQVDYRGYLRDSEKIWPGSYEFGATK